MPSDDQAAKEHLLQQVRAYAARVHRRDEAFVPGETTVPYAGRYFTEDEVGAAVGACLDFWLTLGPEGEAMERELAARLGVRHALLTNSGSSANLLALAALTSPKLPVARRLLPGDEVITCAAGFPTTVAPIVQNGAVPVFLDAEPLTGNPDFSRLEEAYVPGKTKALMCAHALGNPFDLTVAVEFCRRHDLWLIEDNCDALGSTYSMPEAKARALGLDHILKIAETGNHPLVRFEKPETLKPDGAHHAEMAKQNLNAGPSLSACSDERMLTAPTGAFGDLSTQSFYPPHHLTMGEGGAVNVVRETRLKVLIESFRDWGRDCWCASGKDNTCGKRFDWQLGELPRGYDHKYIYSHLGYNLKPTDVQAAIGRVQLRKLDEFGAARRRNWQYLRHGLSDLAEFFDFALPTHATGWIRPGDRKCGDAFAWGFTPSTHSLSLSTLGARCAPSWFGFMLLVRPDAPFTAVDLARRLDGKKIGHRRFFGGNLVRQPAFVQLLRDRPSAFRVVGDLVGADRMMNDGIFVGVYPGLTTPMLDYVIEVVHEFCRLQKEKC